MFRSILVACAIAATLMAYQPAFASLEFDTGVSELKTDMDLKLSFAQKVDPIRSSLRVFDSKGNEVPLRSVIRTTSTQTDLVVSVDPKIKSGSYVIKWKVFFVGFGARSGHTSLHIANATEDVSSR